MADPIFNKVAEFMTDTVAFNAQLAGTAGRDKYNKRTFATAGTALVRSVSGRLIFDTVLRKDSEGREQVEVGRFITLGPPNPELSLADRMTLPGGKVAIIQAVDPISDENGSHHTVVRFGF
jgi:hypothetical protein